MLKAKRETHTKKMTLYHILIHTSAFCVNCNQVQNALSLMCNYSKAILVMSSIINTDHNCIINGHKSETDGAKNARAESTNKGVMWHSKYITQGQQQRSELPTMTLT